MIQRKWMKDRLKKRSDFGHGKLLRELKTSLPVNYQLYECPILLPVRPLTESEDMTIRDG